MKPASSTAGRSIRGTSVGVVSFLVQAFLGIFAVPFLVEGWGQERYGVWLAVQAFVALALTLDTGHQIYVGNEVGKLFHTDHERSRLVLASGVLVALGLGLVEIGAVVTLHLLGHLPNLLGIHRVIYSREGLFWTILLLVGPTVAVGSAGQLLGRLFAPSGFYARALWWGIASKVLLTGVAVSVASARGGLVLTAAATGGTNFVYGCLLLRDIWKKFPAYRPFFRPGKARLGLANLLRSLVMTTSMALAQFQFSGLLLIVSWKYGVATVAAFGTLRTMANTLIQAAGTVFGPASPEFVRLDVLGMKEKLIRGMYSITVVTTWLASVGAAVLIWVAPLLYPVWTRGRITFDLTMFSAIVVSVIWRLSGMPLLNHINASNNRKWLLVVSIGQSIALFVPLIVVSDQLQWGTTGLGLALITSEVFGAFLLPMTWGLEVFVAYERNVFLRLFSVSASTPALLSLGVLLHCLSGSRLALGVTILLLTVLFIFQWRMIPDSVRSQLVHIFAKRFRKR